MRIKQYFMQDNSWIVGHCPIKFLENYENLKLCLKIFWSIYLFIYFIFFWVRERLPETVVQRWKSILVDFTVLSLYTISLNKKRRLWQVKVMFTCISTAIKSNSTNALILIYAVVCRCVSHKIKHDLAKCLFGLMCAQIRDWKLIKEE